MGKIIDITGRKFNKILVIKKNGSDFTLISSGHKAAEEAPADNSDIQDEVNANIDFAFGANGQ